LKVKKGFQIERRGRFILAAKKTPALNEPGRRGKS
jgi:hypothetical protein